MQTITRYFYGLNIMVTLQGHFHRHFTCNFFAFINEKNLERFCGLKKTSYLCSTRTRQASQRCSNVRVVLFNN